MELSSSESLYLYLAPLTELTIFCGEPQQPLSSLSIWPQWLALCGAHLHPPKTLSRDNLHPSEVLQGLCTETIRRR